MRGDVGDTRMSGACPRLFAAVAGRPNVSPASSTFFGILRRRDDSYHELESLMVAVDLYDRLEFAETLAANQSRMPTTRPSR